MITKTSLNEASAALNTVLVMLLQSAKGNTGASGADLTYAVSLLRESAATEIVGGNLSADLLNCFTLAVTAGATLQSMATVYVAAASLAPISKPAQAVVAACESYAVIAMSRILAATTFTSRDDVEAALAQIGPAFGTVETWAGSALLTPLYRTLIGLHAAVTADLTTRSYPLPRLVTYSFGRTLSALAAANRLYGDASRAVELAQENQVFNPVFMPRDGRALSS